MAYGAVAASGCSRGLTAPSGAEPAQTAQAATLIVRVFARSTELPIAGATVQRDTQSWVTDASGELAIPVPIGQEIAIDVAAAGYEPMGAAAVVASDERWTFYLAASH
jgi:hypothetical protein